MADSDDTFLSRWSKLKAHQRKTGVEAPQPAPAEPSTRAQVADLAPVAEANSSPAATPRDQAAGAAANPTEVPSRAKPPLPTLEDVAKLTAESDFSAFVAKGVDRSVSNAAMRKLFHSVPSFNVQDGLDVYIDDYSKLPLLPRARVREMMQARMLGLLDDEVVDQGLPPGETPPGAATLEPAGSMPLGQDSARDEPAQTAGPEPSTKDKAAHENLDLQLQSNHAAEPDGAARCPVAGPGSAVDPKPEPGA